MTSGANRWYLKSNIDACIINAVPLPMKTAPRQRARLTAGTTAHSQRMSATAAPLNTAAHRRDGPRRLRAEALDVTRLRLLGRGSPVSFHDHQLWPALSGCCVRAFASSLAPSPSVLPGSVEAFSSMPSATLEAK